MTRSRKIFVAFAIVFIVFLLTVSYDISRRTTFPGQPACLREALRRSKAGRHGSKPQLKDRLEDQGFLPDSTLNDSTNAIRR